MLRCLSILKSVRENVPSSRSPFSQTGMCGVIRLAGAGVAVKFLLVGNPELDKRSYDVIADILSQVAQIDFARHVAADENFQM